MACEIGCSLTAVVSAGVGGWSQDSGLNSKSYMAGQVDHGLPLYYGTSQERMTRWICLVQGRNKCLFPSQAPVAFSGTWWWAAGGWQPLVLVGGAWQADPSIFTALQPVGLARPHTPGRVLKEHEVGFWPTLTCLSSLLGLPISSEPSGGHLFTGLERLCGKVEWASWGCLDGSSCKGLGKWR